MSASSFVCSFLMLFGLGPAALCIGFATANGVAWLIRPARQTFDAEAVGHAGTGFREATVTLFRLGAWALAVGFIVALIAAYYLKSLR